jgi:predicted DNA repair protein MutK
MAIALAEVSGSPLIQRGIALALVAVAITVLVYGAVALIVKMDDVGLHLSKRSGAGARAVGRVLLGAMPWLLTILSVVGTVAMLWVGGGIILHGLEELGWHAPSDAAHAIQHSVEHVSGGLSAVTGWLIYATVSAIVGLGLGAIVAVVLHKVLRVGAH